MAYHSSYTGPQIDQAVSHAVNMDVNPTAGHTDRVVSSGGVKSAISSSAVNTGITGVYAYKAGSVVTITAENASYVSASSAGWVVIGTLPSELRPPVSINFVGYDNQATGISNLPAQYRIRTNGEIAVYLFSELLSCIPRFTISYVV